MILDIQFLASYRGEQIPITQKCVCVCVCARITVKSMRLYQSKQMMYTYMHDCITAVCDSVFLKVHRICTLSPVI